MRSQQFVFIMLKGFVYESYYSLCSSKVGISRYYNKMAECLYTFFCLSVVLWCNFKTWSSSTTKQYCNHLWVTKSFFILFSKKLGFHPFPTIQRVAMMECRRGKSQAILLTFRIIQVLCQLWEQLPTVSGSPSLNIQIRKIERICFNYCTWRKFEL